MHCQSFCVRYWHANTGVRTSRRLRGQPPEGQMRREVGSVDSQEAKHQGKFSYTL